MSAQTGRWYEPIAPGAERTRSIGWWGLLLGAAALITFQGTITAAYLYLRWAQPTWPPTGFAAPALWPLVAAVPAVAAAAAASWGWAGVRRRQEGRVPAAMGLATLLGVVTVALRAWQFAGLDFRWDEHAYTSLVWFMSGYEIVILVTAVIVGLVTLAQGTLGMVDAERSASTEVATLYWWFAAVTTLLSLGTLHLGAYA